MEVNIQQQGDVEINYLIIIRWVCLNPRAHPPPTSPPDGLGTNMNTLMAICRFHEDIEAVDLLASVSAGKEGNPTGNNQHSRGTVDIISSSTKEGRPTGTSASATMRRLSKDYPAIHARTPLTRVIAGSGVGSAVGSAVDAHRIRSTL